MWNWRICCIDICKEYRRMPGMRLFSVQSMQCSMLLTMVFGAQFKRHALILSENNDTHPHWILRIHSNFSKEHVRNDRFNARKNHTTFNCIAVFHSQLSWLWSQCVRHLNSASFLIGDSTVVNLVNRQFERLVVTSLNICVSVCAL